MNPAAWARLRLLVRALGYFRPDAGRIGLWGGLLLAGIAKNLSKPWPLAILVDSVLGNKPFPPWLPSQLTDWAQPAQLTAIVAASMALHLTHSAVCAGHVYVTIGVGLRGLRRGRDEGFGWVQRPSPRHHQRTAAGDAIFPAGTHTTALPNPVPQRLFII